MKIHVNLLAASLFLLTATAASAAIQVTIDSNDADGSSAVFKFKHVPSPSTNDAATSAKFSIVTGEQDPAGGDLDKLHDGKLPESEDQPEENFFFNAGTAGGRIQVDLGSAIDVKQINTYSWHPSDRAPQIYKVYGSDGSATGFNATPGEGTSPTNCGWTLIADVNTKAKDGEQGHQYGVSVADTDGNVGKYRYLLFDAVATERDDDFGNTFYSEIDVIDAKAPAVAPVAATEAAAAPGVFVIKTTDGQTITIDTSGAPDLTDWADHTLAPVLADWYVKIVNMFPSEGYTAPTQFKVTIKPMDGVAYTAGKNVSANSDWLSQNLKGEAVGSLVHELVHVVQQFHHRDNPGWLVEGSADYVRWFLYEPPTVHGADIVWMKKLRRFDPHYDASYRVTANFLKWVTEKYDTNLVTQMNTAMRQGHYSEDLWKQYTGKTVQDLGEEWKKDIESQVGVKPQAQSGAGETAPKPN